jgi:serine/threonine protein kinase/WD40 repeat protein
MTEESIFAAALEKTDPAQRAAFLAQACAGDDALRRQVEELLQAHEAPGSFLNKPAALPAVTAAFSPASTLREGPGTRIGPYKLLQQIGEGGMGVVYMAEQEEPVRRKLALKIIKPGMDSAQVIARFEAERQALALMDHQNIARVLDAGTTENGLPYFVMELVHGVPITTFCDNNQLTPRQRLELFIPICHAIQHAHQKGIIHRDIKPSNVLVTMYDDKPVPKVIDFGVAKAVEQRLTEKTLFTQFGALVGTFEYMSPEQAEMNAFGVDTRSDIFSLGVLLYELLTGSTPLEKTRMREVALNEIVRLIKEEEPPRPSVRLSSSGTLAKIAAARKTQPAQLSKLVRGELDWIVMRALEKDRNRRYETANAFARDVERYLKDEPVEACPPSAGYLLRKFVRKHQAALATTVAFAMLLMLGAGVSAWLAVRATSAEASAIADRDERAKAEASAIADRDERAKAEAIALAALRNEKSASYANRVALAHAEWRDNHLSLATGLLDKCLAELRGWEWHYVNRLCRPTALTLPSFGSTVAYSPDGRYIATGSTDGLSNQKPCGARVWDAVSGKLLFVQKGLTNPIGFAAFSADGRYLATAHHEVTVSGIPGGEAKVWDIATGKEVFSLMFNRPVSSMALSPDGQRLYLDVREDEKNDFRVYSVADAKRLPSPIPPPTCGPFALSRDGQRLAMFDWSVNTHPVAIYDALTGKKLATCSLSGPGSVFRLAFSPDGRRLGAVCGWEAVVWDASTGKKLYAIEHGPDLRFLAFSPDSKLLALSIKSDVKITAADTGRELFTLRTGYPREIKGLAFHPDGDRLATSGIPGEEVKVWEVGDREVRTIAHLPHDLSQNGHEPDNLVFSPDGLTFAAIGVKDMLDPNVNNRGGVVRLFDLATACEVGVHRMPKDQPDDRFLRLVYRPDGKLLALCATKTKDSKTYGLEVRDLTAERTLFTIREQGLATILEWELQRWAAFSADGSRLAVAAYDGDQDVTVWDVARGQVIGTLPAGTYGTNGGVIQLSPDGRRLAVVRFGGVVTKPGAKAFSYFDVETGKLLVEGDTNNLCFSPDGRQVAVNERDNKVVILDATTGKQRHTLAEAGLFVAFSPDSSRLATTRKVWDTATGKPVCAWDLNVWASGVFSPDGRRLATRGNEFGRNQVEIWDAQSGHQMFTLRGLTVHPVSRIHFSQDGHRLVAIDALAIRIWNATPLPGQAGR